MERKSRILFLALSVALAIAAILMPVSVGATGPKGADRIKVAFASLGAIYAPHLLAMEKGYFAEENIEMEFFMGGGGVTTPALLSGQITATTSSSSALNAIMKGGQAKIVYTNTDRPGYELWSSRPEIKTIGDLVGKQIGIQTRGDSHELTVRMLLLQNGLNPNSVIYTPIGRGATRLAAVQAGAVDAVTLSLIDLYELKEAKPKGHLLADAKKEVQAVYTGLAVANKYLAEREDVIERFLRATAKGRDYFRKYREQTLNILVKYNLDRFKSNRDKTRRALDIDYEDILGSMTEDGTVSEEVQRREAEVRASILKVMTIRPLHEMFDYGLMRKVYAELRARGWQPKP